MSKETKQRLFDISLNHIKEQGVPALSDDSHDSHITCAYMNDEGLSCAAAPFIINPALLAFEGSWSSLVWDVQQDPSGVDPTSQLDGDAIQELNLVASIQRAHDRAARMSLNQDNDFFMELFLQNMRELAKIHELKFA